LWQVLLSACRRHFCNKWQKWLAGGGGLACGSAGIVASAVRD